MRIIYYHNPKICTFYTHEMTPEEMTEFAGEIKDFGKIYIFEEFDSD